MTRHRVDGAVCAAVTREDFWRLDPPGHLPVHEWHHFIVVAPGLELLVNFSVSTNTWGRGRSTRVIVVARTDAWHGFIDSARPGDGEFSRDASSCRVAAHCLTIEAGRYRLEIHAPERSIELDLELRPRSLPMIAPGQPVGGGRRLSWLMVPRIAARGIAEIAGRRFELREAAGYHDHNWGEFAWGDDFCWEWGVGLPDDPALDDALILSSLQDRTRARRVLEQMFLWRGGRNVLAISGPELEIVTHGSTQLADREGWQLPPVMSLLRQRSDADVPERLVLGANGPRGRVHADFWIESVAELVLPSDRDPLGLVTIHECVGRLEVEINLAQDDDLPRRWLGRGVFEFVRNGPTRRSPPAARTPEFESAPIGTCASAAELLEAAILMLEREAPEHAHMLAECLATIGAAIDVCIDAELLSVHTERGRTVVARGRAAGGIRVRTDLATALALTDERLGIERAIRERRLELHAEHRVLRQLGHACRIFVHGLVRSPSAGRLVLRLRELSHDRACVAREQ
jgi:hypothetical protein